MTPMRRRLRPSIPLLILALAVPLAAQPKAVAGKVERVTLYRGQALVTRVVQVDAAAGLSTIVVEGLPELVVQNSLFAEGGDGLDVRAVRLRTTPIGEDQREAVRELEAQIENLTRRQGVQQRNIELLNRQMLALDRLDGFVTPTAQTELTRGVLNPETLERLITFGFEQRQKLTEQILAAEDAQRQMQKELELLGRRRAEFAMGTNRSRRDAYVDVESRGAGAKSLRVSYLVGGCNWSPSYNLRGAGDLARIEVEVNGLIEQRSGEDWSGVELTLSTATPALNASAPSLAPFDVALAPSAPLAAGRMQMPSQVLYVENAKKLKDIRLKQTEACNDLNVASSLGANVTSNWALNRASNESQTIELTLPNDVAEAVLNAPEANQGPSVSYGLETRVSLPSRPDAQLVRIASATLDAKAYYLAAPVLTPYVYREATLVNTGRLDLLGGPMSVYLDGRFVGRGELDAVARGQTFVIGFGADPQLRARRDREDRTETVQGGNMVVGLKYRITIENFKDKPVDVHLLDRVPHTADKDALRVTLGAMSAKLSEDPLYLRLDRPNGILRWDLQVAASSSGESARLLDFAYTLEHDKNFALAGVAEGESQQALQLFETQLRSRLVR